MACSNLTTSQFKGCNTSPGGVEVVYLANQHIVGNTASFTFSPTISVDNTDTGAITGATANSGAKFYTFYPNKQSSSFKQSQVKDPKTGNVIVTQTIIMVFGKTEAAKRNFIKLMAQDDFYAIVKDTNGKYWLSGEQRGLDLITADSDTGTAYTDLNGYTLTLQAMENYYAREVSASIIAGLLSAV